MTVSFQAPATRNSCRANGTAERSSRSANPPARSPSSSGCGWTVTATCCRSRRTRARLLTGPGVGLGIVGTRLPADTGPPGDRSWGPDAARRVATGRVPPHTSGGERSQGEGYGLAVGEQLSRRAILALGVTGLTYGLVGCGEQRRSAHLGPSLPHVPEARGPRQLAPVRSRPVFVVHELLPHAPPDAVALTIDDGPHPQWTPRILDLLARERVPATFSVVGGRARAFPTLVRRIVAEGHGVCNHTLTHPQPFPRLPAEEIERQVAEAQAAIADAATVSPHLFRSPGGGVEPGRLRHRRAPRPGADRLGCRPARLGPTRHRRHHPAVAAGQARRH